MGRLVLKRSFQEIAGPAASLAENSWVDGKNCSWMIFLKKTWNETSALWRETSAQNRELMRFVEWSFFHNFQFHDLEIGLQNPK